MKKLPRLLDNWRASCKAMQLERDAALKTCDELRDIRNLLVRSLVKATGETEEAVQEAPFGVACRHRAEIDKPRPLKSHCGTCDGSGVVDSGGMTPWDAPIDIACPECKAKRDAAFVNGLERAKEIAATYNAETNLPLRRYSPEEIANAIQAEIDKANETSRTKAGKP